MGNKIGFEVDSETVKLGYVEQDQSNIAFIAALKSKYLVTELKLGSSTIFLFQCPVAEFLNYPATDNAALLRNQYLHLLTGDELVIRTNRATMNTLKQSTELELAMTEVIMKKFRLEHTERIENSVHAMMILERNQQEFFSFTQNFSILELNSFEKVFSGEKRFIQPIPDKLLVVSLRNGVTAYRVDQGKIERIDGSIIGENTFTSILRMKFPEASVQECIELAFSSGNLKNVDLLVEDIYGKGSAKIGLPGEMVASSLGKFGKMKQCEAGKVDKSDIMRSLITSFAINTAHWAMLYLKTTQLKHAIVLADIFHNDKFYAIVQVPRVLCSQSGSAMPQKMKCTSPGTRRSWGALGRPSPTSYPESPQAENWGFDNISCLLGCFHTAPQ
jgi:hypothetical protein